MIHRCTLAISEKRAKKNPEKGRGLGHVTDINFGVHPNVSRKRVEIETCNLVHRCKVAISPKPAMKNLEKGAWSRSRDPINFGVHIYVSPKRVELET